eukprot:SAG22_NODE_6099_length_898_cov_1.665832_1_plen_268_part_01
MPAELAELTAELAEVDRQLNDKQGAAGASSAEQPSSKQHSKQLAAGDALMAEALAAVATASPARQAPPSTGGGVSFASDDSRAATQGQLPKRRLARQQTGPSLPVERTTTAEREDDIDGLLAEAAAELLATPRELADAQSLDHAAIRAAAAAVGTAAAAASSGTSGDGGGGGGSLGEPGAAAAAADELSLQRTTTAEALDDIDGLLGEVAYKASAGYRAGLGIRDQSMSPIGQELAAIKAEVDAAKKMLAGPGAAEAEGGAAGVMDVV